MRYRNLEPPYEPHPMSTVLKWAVGDKLAGRRRRSPDRYPEMRVVEPDRALLASGAPSLTWVGHATWLLRLGGQAILTDPVWSESLGPGITRNVRPGVALEEAAPTVVVVSHNHRDHLDAPTIRRLGAAPTYIVPAGLGPFFTKRGADKVIELKWWESARVGELEIHFVPSQHWSQRGPLDKNESLWGGFVLQAQEKKVYFAGDTAHFGGFAEIGRRFPELDAALLPIGAYDPEWFMRVQHMNPKDAIEAFKSLRARLLCAMHWGPSSSPMSRSTSPRASWRSSASKNRSRQSGCGSRRSGNHAGSEPRPAKACSIALFSTAAGCAPLTARRWSKMKKGTPEIPCSARASASARVRERSSSLSRTSRESGENPCAPLSSVSTARSPMSRPSWK